MAVNVSVSSNSFTFIAYRSLKPSNALSALVLCKQKRIFTKRLKAAASCKVVKYACWTLITASQGEFVPIAVESHGPINRDALQFLSKLGRLLAETTRDVRASSFLFQRISVVVQRFNSVLLHDGFVDDDRPE